MKGKNAHNISEKYDLSKLCKKFQQRNGNYKICQMEILEIKSKVTEMKISQNELK